MVSNLNMEFSVIEILSNCGVLGIVSVRTIYVKMRSHIEGIYKVFCQKVEHLNFRLLMKQVFCEERWV
ncbi:hypothetical protein DEA98_00960 [Brucella pseudogrignonensis]|nr:hypothetical protein [Brucella pseudogrignonensis]